MDHEDLVNKVRAHEAEIYGVRGDDKDGLKAEVAQLKNDRDDYKQFKRWLLGMGSAIGLIAGLGIEWAAQALGLKK